MMTYWKSINYKKIIINTEMKNYPVIVLGHRISKLYKSISELDLEAGLEAITKDRFFERTTILNQLHWLALYHTYVSTKKGQKRPVLLERVGIAFEFETTR